MGPSCTKSAQKRGCRGPSASKTLVLTRAPGTTRTCDLRFRKPLLYPLSYGGGGWQLELQLATW